MADGEPTPYQVDLEVFRGPLDLLLYLVKRDEVDILDIPIARVCEQFLAYLNGGRLIDVEGASDFLVMASTLTEIKSKFVLPRPPELSAPEEDPRLDLVRQLLEYKLYKDLSALLEARAAEHSLRLPRAPAAAEHGANPDRPPLKPVELWDLVSAFGRLMRETMALQPQAIVVDQTPLHVYMDTIVRQLEAAPRLPFSAVFTPPHTRGRLVGLFLAVLELTKSRRLLPEQPDPFGDIWLVLAPPPGPPASGQEKGEEKGDTGGTGGVGQAFRTVG